MVDFETALLATRSKSELTDFLETVLTPEEIEQCRTRWRACQMSAAGATQREIRKELGVGLATATRAAKTTRKNGRIVHLLIRRVK